jgi:hypothetical protein
MAEVYAFLLDALASPDYGYLPQLYVSGTRVRVCERKFHNAAQVLY